MIRQLLLIVCVSLYCVPAALSQDDEEEELREPTSEEISRSDTTPHPLDPEPESISESAPEVTLPDDHD